MHFNSTETNATRKEFTIWSAIEALKLMGPCCMLLSYRRGRHPVESGNYLQSPWSEVILAARVPHCEWWEHCLLGLKPNDLSQEKFKLEIGILWLLILNLFFFFLHALYPSPNQAQAGYRWCWCVMRGLWSCCSSQGRVQ